MGDQEVNRLLIPTNTHIVRTGPMDTTATVSMVYRAAEHPLDEPESVQPLPFGHYYDQSVEPTGDEVLVTKPVIGWTEEITSGAGYRTLLFNNRDIQPSLPIATDVFTDTIFPVLTKGSNALPLRDDLQIPINVYQNTVQLFLMEILSESHDTAVVANIGVSDSVESTVRIGNYKADLHLFYTTLKTDEFAFQSVVRRVVDLSNDSYPMVGLYAGPNAPPDRRRMAWDVWEMSARFRHSAHSQRFLQRIGYLVSKYGLLCVNERHRDKALPDLNTGDKFYPNLAPIDTMKSADEMFTSLLKERAFCLCDSQHVYTVAGTKPFYFKYDHSGDEHSVPNAPKVVVIEEGVNSLTINASQYEDYSYLASNLLMVGMKGYPLTIDWHQFQRDFEQTLAATDARPTVSARMLLNEINDYIVVSTPEYDVCFSLCWHFHRHVFPRDPIFIDMWNVFVRKARPKGAQEGTGGDSLFYYYMSVQYYFKASRDFKSDRGAKSAKEFVRDHQFRCQRLFDQHLSHIYAHIVMEEFEGFAFNKYGILLANKRFAEFGNRSPISVARCLCIQRNQILFIPTLD